MMSEIWKSVVGYEGSYEVSNLGNVRSVNRYRRTGKGERFIPGAPLARGKFRNGYSRATLNIDQVPKYALVHVLVAEAFLSPRPSAKHEVNHIDGDKSNNCVENLEWVTRSANILHRINMNDNGVGERQWAAKLTAHDIPDIRFLLANKVPQSKIAALYGVSQSQITSINCGLTWKRVA